jgi:hypothetical protein
MVAMKKALTVLLKNEDVIELIRILMDSAMPRARWKSCGSISKARHATCSRAAER